MDDDEYFRNLLFDEIEDEDYDAQLALDEQSSTQQNSVNNSVKKTYKKTPTYSEILAKVDNGDWKLSSKSNGKYGKFLRSYTDSTKKLTDYVICTGCNAVFARKSYRSIKAHVEKEFSKEIPIAGTIEDDFLKFVVGDSRAFNLVDTENFHDFLSNVIPKMHELMIKNSDLTVSNLIPSGQKLSRSVQQKYYKAFAEKVQPLLPIANKNGFSITADFANKNANYLVITLHFFDDSWKLYGFVLKMMYFPHDVAKTKEVVTKTVMEELKNLGLNGNCHVVTDEGTNMCGFDNHVNCACHQLSTVAKHVTELYADTQLDSNVVSICQTVRKTLIELRKFIGKARKKSSICEQLGTSLSLPVITRWASTFTMVNNYLSSRDQISEVLQKEDNELYNMHKNLLQNHLAIFNAYVNLLEPISSYINDLEAEKNVTSSSVLPVFAGLLYMFELLSNSECPYESALSKAAKEALEKKISKINTKVAFVSAYLDPNIRPKLNDLCSKVSRFSMDKIIKCVKDEAQKLFIPKEQTNASISNSRFNLFSSNQSDRTLEKEFTTYEMLVDGTAESDEQIEFWKKFGNRMPTLNALAKKYLCVTASSASSERAFSKLKHILTDPRNRLSPETASELINFQSLINGQFDLMETKVEDNERKRQHGESDTE